MLNELSSEYTFNVRPFGEWDRQSASGTWSFSPAAPWSVMGRNGQAIFKLSTNVTYR